MRPWAWRDKSILMRGETLNRYAERGNHKHFQHDIINGVSRRLYFLIKVDLKSLL